MRIIEARVLRRENTGLFLKNLFDHAVVFFELMDIDMSGAQNNVKTRELWIDLRQINGRADGNQSVVAAMNDFYRATDIFQIVKSRNVITQKRFRRHKWKVPMDRTQQRVKWRSENQEPRIIFAASLAAKPDPSDRP